MNYLKYILGVVVLGGILWAGVTYPQVKQVLGSAVGTTFNTAKIAAVDMSPATRAATTTSILNSDSSARWVTGIDIGCTGVGTSYTDVTGAGLAQLLLQAATTSVANEGLQANTNLVANVLVGTSTSFAQSASSTVASTGSQNNDFYYWPSGTYLTYTFNATNTAACIVAAKYIPS